MTAITCSFLVGKFLSQHVTQLPSFFFFSYSHFSLQSPMICSLLNLSGRSRYQLPVRSQSSLYILQLCVSLYVLRQSILYHCTNSSTSLCVCSFSLLLLYIRKKLGCFLSRTLPIDINQPLSFSSFLCALIADFFAHLLPPPAAALVQHLN